MNKKRFLFLQRRSPAEGQRAFEALDAALTAAAFDQSVRLLFLDDGVWQLKRGQQASDGRNPMALLGGLDVYDVVTPPMVEAESLQERGLREEDLMIPVALVWRRQVPEILEECELSLIL